MWAYTRSSTPSIKSFTVRQKLCVSAATGISVRAVLQALFYCSLIFYTHLAVFSSVRRMPQDFFLLDLAPS